MCKYVIALCCYQVAVKLQVQMQTSVILQLTIILASIP